MTDEPRKPRYLSQQHSRTSDRYARISAARRGDERPQRKARSQEPAPHRYERSIDASHYNRERYTSHPSRQRAMPVSQQNYAAVHVVKPVSRNILLALGAIAAALLVIIVLRFVAFGATAGEYGQIRGQIADAQSQAAALEVENAQMQEQLDTWQVTIDEYEARSQK